MRSKKKILLITKNFIIDLLGGEQHGHMSRIGYDLYCKMIKETVDEVNTNVKSLMAMPGKRYETLIVSVITALAGAFVGFLLSGNIPV